MKQIDWSVLLLVIIFIIFALIMIADISIVEAEVNFGDKFYFLKRQLIWAIGGGILTLIFTFLDYHLWQKLARLIFFSALIALALVFVPGIGISAYGAKRWLNLGIISFQPVELAKLATIIYFSSLLSQEKQKPFWQQLIILFLMITLIFLEPDFSSAVLIIAVVGALWFFEGKSLILLGVLGILGVLGGTYLIFSSPYRKQRVLGLLDPFYDPQGKSYHAHQLVLTLGSGGWLGTGLGNSRQKYRYLPEATTDSIMALVAEELGFLGILIFTILFSFFLVRCFSIASRAADKFGQLLGASIASLIAFQAIINLGAIAIMLPLTGMPFPFVSYGGSSLITLLVAMGILFNISRQSNNHPRRKQL